MKNGLIINKYGNKFWYKNNDFHREDGPAIEYTNGYKAWFYEGEYHREKGPAREWLNGNKSWYKKGKLHREDGPAIERKKIFILKNEATWELEWYYKGERIYCSSNKEFLQIIKLKLFW